MHKKLPPQDWKKTITMLILLQPSPIAIVQLYPLWFRYYGENVLHMATTNEDPAMVKYLLDAGVNFQVLTENTGLAIWHLIWPPFLVDLISSTGALLWQLLLHNWSTTKQVSKTEQQQSRFQKYLSKVTKFNLYLYSKRRAGIKTNCHNLPILIWILKRRTDILTQERVVIRTTTNYVVCCILNRI